MDRIAQPPTLRLTEITKAYGTFQLVVPELDLLAAHHRPQEGQELLLEELQVPLRVGQRRTSQGTKRHISVCKAYE